MPKIGAIRSTIARLPEAGPPLVAVLPGGTTGIGSYVAQSLAKVFAKHGTKLRVYVVGRNAERAQKVIKKCKETSPGSDYRFIQATNLALINEVDKACEEVIRQETESPLHEAPSIDLLYLSFCVNIFGKQNITPEGLDSFLSCVYYARIQFIQKLMPLLTAGPYPGHAISIYAGTFEDGTKPGEEPIGLPSPETWGVSGVRKHACFMKNFVFEELAAKHEGKLSLIHIYPGLVDGPGFYSTENPGWFKFVWPLVKLLSSFYRTSPEDCGDAMLYLATGQFPAKNSKNERVKSNLEVAKSTLGISGGGAYAVGDRAEAPKNPIMYEKVRTAETSKKVWDHTFETLRDVEEKNTRS